MGDRLRKQKKRLPAQRDKQKLGVSDKVDQDLEIYLDDANRNIADEFGGQLSPVRGSMLVGSPTGLTAESRMKPGLINDGQPVRRGFGKTTSFLEDAQFDFNQLEKELQQERRHQDRFNATAAAQSKGPLLDPEPKTGGNALGSTMLKQNQDDVDGTGEAPTGRQYRLE